MTVDEMHIASARLFGRCLPVSGLDVSGFPANVTVICIIRLYVPKWREPGRKFVHSDIGAIPEPDKAVAASIASPKRHSNCASLPLCVRG
jgi:hypothetical protein